MRTRERFLSLTIAAVTALPAQQARAPLTITDAVEGALHNYPSIRVSQEQINAAAAGIQLARTAYLPRVDAMAQANRATRNNVFGLLLPQSVIPSMSGPVIGTNNFGTAWGSAVGGLVTWEPFDFGLREANVAVATAVRNQSAAALKRTQFDVAVSAATAYLTLAAAEETVRAAHALDQKTRTMPVELDVFNSAGSLSPGMYPSVKWPVRRSHPALYVPKTSVVTTTERMFVIRDRSGRAEWVDVRKGAEDGDLVEVMGNLQPGDRVVRRATDEIRDGAALPTVAK